MKNMYQLHIPQRRCRQASLFSICWVALVILFGSSTLCTALSISASYRSPRVSQLLPGRQISSPGKGVSSISSSPLFTLRRMQAKSLLHSPSETSQSTSPTALRMVLTTPEAIFEQASTETLLDDLIDESVRTTARRPIMMQFDPSRGWVSIF
jgi:hypothetical protein